MKVKDAPYNWSQDKKHSGITVPMHLSQTAGLGVTHSRRLKVNNKTGTKEVIVLRSWDIMTYPSGYAVAQGFKTKTDAMHVAEHDLHGFSWVCLFFADFEKNNDMKAVRQRLAAIRNVWGVR